MKFVDRLRQRDIPLKFVPIYKTVSLEYPNNIDNPNYLEFCGPYWVSLLCNFFDQYKDYIQDVDTNTGMSAAAIFVNFNYNVPDDIITDICNRAIAMILENSKPKYKIRDKIILKIEENTFIHGTIKEVCLDNDVDYYGFTYHITDHYGNTYEYEPEKDITKDNNET